MYFIKKFIYLLYAVLYVYDPLWLEPKKNVIHDKKKKSTTNDKYFNPKI